ncbi:uncharacterized protein LOC123709094 [Pieris brassicae]|uniref:uncharacterized protein LOC123709094 n=1 Tax=Pieris brassicae TaxID=7116 RepID=UPI001E66024E|nr:uncharacterized protein LOC123709094 [Pieris brassicae]
MKFLVLGLALLVAGSSAFPDVQGRQSEGELFADNFKKAIEAIQRYIVRNNLDPIVVARADRTIARFPYLNVRLFVEGLNFSGLSDIVIHTLDYSNVFSRFRYDLELPELDFVIADSGITGTVVSTNVNAKLAGKLTISNGRLAGEAYVQYNVVTGTVTITELVANLSIKAIKSDITLELLDNDLSEWLNNLLNVRIPNFLEENESDINRVLAVAIKAIAQLYLDNRPRPVA